MTASSFGFDLSTNTTIDPTSLPSPTAPPIAVPDGPYTVPENTILVVNASAGVLANDILPAVPVIPAAASATQYFLLIDGLTGDSTDPGHQGWFDLGSFDFDVSAVIAAIGAGGSAGKATFAPLLVDLNRDPDLAGALSDIALGRIIQSVRIEGVSGDQAVYDLTLTDASLTAVHDQKGGFDSLTFDGYQRVGLITRAQQPDGSLVPASSFGFDLSTNTTIDPTSLPSPSVGTATPAASATQYFLLIDGLTGDSTDPGHQGWFDLSSFDFDVSAVIAAIGAGGSAGKATFAPLLVELTRDPDLAGALSDIALGRTIPSVRIEGVSGGQAVYDLTLTDASLTAVHDQKGFDSLTFDGYQRVGLITRAQRPADGSLVTASSFGFDLSTNTTINPNNLPSPSVGTATPAASATQYFLLIDGLTGDSTDPGHQGWFDLSSFEFDVSAVIAAIGAGGSAGKATFAPLVVELTRDPDLAGALSDIALGRTIPSVRLEGVSGGQAVSDLTLTDASLTAVHDRNGFDSLTFDGYQQIGLITRAQRPADGSLVTASSFGFDLSTNTTIDPTSLPSPKGPGQFTDVLVSTTAHGQLTLNPDGSFVYTPDPNFTGMDAFVYRATDGVTTTNDATVQINVSAVNHSPVLSPDTGSPHSLIELADATNSSTRDAVSGTLSFTDADIGDTHSGSAVLNSEIWSGGSTVPAASLTSLANAMTARIIADGTAGTLGWDFSLPDVDVDFLAVGETLTAVYNVAVTDGHAATATQPITIIFTGSNDAPTISAATSILAGSITELASSTGSLTVDSTAGTISFADPDLNDLPMATIPSIGQTVTWQDASHVYTLSPAQITALTQGFTISAEPGNTNSGQIDWNYAVPDKQLDFLGVGEALTVTSPVVIDDHHGGTSTENIVVTINGSNDNPIAAADSNATTRNSTLTVMAPNGVLANDTDPDTHDQGHLSVGAVNGSAMNVGHAVVGAYGKLTLMADGSYSYTANQVPLPTQIVAQDVFSYTATNGHGGTSTATLTLAVFDPDVAYLTGIDTTLVGGNGKAVIDGSAGGDVLIGGNGTDVLIGGNGDTITGGNGPDTIVFRPNFGLNTIVDFDTKNDNIQFSSALFTNFAEVKNAGVQVGADTRVSYDAADALLLKNVSLTALDASNFHFG